MFPPAVEEPYETMDHRTRLPFTARDWFRKFRELYNSSAASPLTELGLFYERHRLYAEYRSRSDPTHSEYTDEEWNRVMAALLAGLAAEMGLVQAQDVEGRPQLDWFLPGVTDRSSVVIRATSEATDGLLGRDLTELANSDAELAVLLVYPDYPLPEGATDAHEAVRLWRARIEHRLRELRPKPEVLALMISAYSFELPAPWQGFAWNPKSDSLLAT